MPKIVIPGDELPRGIKFKRGVAFIKDGIPYAAVVGMLEENTFVPFENVYIPQEGDPIVGIIMDERHGSYAVDANMAFPTIVPTRSVATKFRLGDFIFGKVMRVEEGGTVVLGEVKHLKGGKIIDVPASKVPRIIGKKASMIKLITEKTGTPIYVGSSGYIWVGNKGKITKAIKAIKAIVRKAHLSGLTDEISKLLEVEE